EDPYRWFVLLGGFLAQAISMGTLSSIMQDYYDRQVFKGTVDSTQLSFVGTLGFMFSGLLGPVSQILVSAFGTRWVMFIATILISSGLIFASFSVELWHLYMTQSILHGIGAAILNILSMVIAPQWFSKRRGFAMGVMMSGAGVGGGGMPFLMNELNENLGGAWCYRVLGIISFVVSLMCKDKKPNRHGWRNVIDFKICKDSKFIIWCIAGNLSMMAYFVPVFYLPSHATKLGLLPSQGSMLVAVFSAVNIIGRVLSGYLGDNFGAVNINIIFLLTCGMSSLFIWTMATSYVALMIFIVIYGVMSGSVFSLSARLGPSMAGAIQTATDKNSYFAQQLFTGLAFVLSAIVIIVLKFKLKRGVFVKV
ncbi:major facilitator superfamily domain-containing protein, partial [Absidia repens]